MPITLSASSANADIGFARYAEGENSKRRSGYRKKESANSRLPAPNRAESNLSLNQARQSNAMPQATIESDRRRLGSGVGGAVSIKVTKVYLGPLWVESGHFAHSSLG